MSPIDKDYQGRFRGTLHSETIDHGKETKVSSIDHRTIESKKVTPMQADNVINTVYPLINNQDFKPFFYKKLYAIGATRFMHLADIARKGDNPGKLFVYLLNKEPS